MAVQKDVCTFSIPAGAALTSHQFRIVKRSTGNAVIVAATNDLPCGVLQNNPGSAETAEIAYGGIVRVVAGAQVAIDDVVVTNANGFGIKGTIANDGTIDAYAIGIAHSAAAGSAEIFSVRLYAGGPVPVALT